MSWKWGWWGSEGGVSHPASGSGDGPRSSFSQRMESTFCFALGRHSETDRQRQTETERDCMFLVGQSQLCLLHAETKCLLFFLSHGGFGQRVLEELRFPQREESSDSSLLRSKVLSYIFGCEPNLLAAEPSLQPQVS